MMKKLYGDISMRFFYRELFSFVVLFFSIIMGWNAIAIALFVLMILNIFYMFHEMIDIEKKWKKTW